MTVRQALQLCKELYQILVGVHHFTFAVASVRSTEARFKCA
jgi:hypothetical protein